MTPENRKEICVWSISYIECLLWFVDSWSIYRSAIYKTNFGRI